MVCNCLRHILCFRAFTRAKLSMIELTSIVRSNSLLILINVSMFRRPCPIVVRWAFFIRRSYENERSPVQNNEQRRPTGVIRQTKILHIEVINIKSLTKYGVWLNAIITFTATKRARECLPVPGRDTRIC